MTRRAILALLVACFAVGLLAVLTQHSRQRDAATRDAQTYQPALHGSTRPITSYAIDLSEFERLPPEDRQRLREATTKFQSVGIFTYKDGTPVLISVGGERIHPDPGKDRAWLEGRTATPNLALDVEYWRQHPEETPPE